MERPPPLTEKQKLAIRTLAKKRTPVWIANKLDLPEWRVRRWCKKLGVVPPHGKDRPLHGVDVLAAIEELGDVAAVAEHYGCSEQAVRWRRARQRKQESQDHEGR